MLLTSSRGELMEDQILQYCEIVLNINDSIHTYTHTHTHIYIYIIQSSTLGFVQSLKIFKKTHV